MAAIQICTSRSVPEISVNASGEKSEPLIFTGVSEHGVSGSIRATSTKVSKSSDCENSILGVAFRAVLRRLFKWLDFANSRLVSTHFAGNVSQYLD